MYTYKYKLQLSNMFHVLCHYIFYTKPLHILKLTNFNIFVPHGFTMILCTLKYKTSYKHKIIILSKSTNKFQQPKYPSKFFLPAVHLQASQLLILHVLCIGSPVPITPPGKLLPLLVKPLWLYFETASPLSWIVQSPKPLSGMATSLLVYPYQIGIFYLT